MEQSSRHWTSSARCSKHKGPGGEQPPQGGIKQCHSRSRGWIMRRERRGDYVRLTYSRKYFADSNRVFATVPGAHQSKNRRASHASDVRVFDVGDPKAVVGASRNCQRGNGEFGIEVTTGRRWHKEIVAVLNSTGPRARLSLRPIAVSPAMELYGRRKSLCRYSFRR
jgi:hypothetical protein